MSGPADAARPLVVVSTGTDKRFAFDRLIDWVEHWAEERPGVADLHVQWGVSRPSVLPGGVQLSGVELDELLGRASAVVLQGGPGGIMRSRQHGILPIVVPREGRLAEAVDDHQVHFCSWAAARQRVVLARSEGELHAALDRVVADRAAYRFEPEPPETAATVARFAARIDRLWRTGT